MSLRDDLFVEPDESVDGSLSDLQGGKVREKVIANNEIHEHPVIYGSLDGGGGERERERERQLSTYTSKSLVYMQKLTSKSKGIGRPSMRSSHSKYCSTKV